MEEESETIVTASEAFFRDLLEEGIFGVEVIIGESVKTLTVVDPEGEET